MPSVVIDLRSTDDRRDVVHRAVQALAEGRLVVFPTETVYGVAASALDERAVANLLKAKGRPAGHPLALAIRSADEAHDYAPDMSPLARRLARRCWPGPITLVVDDSHPESLVRRLPSSVQRAVSPNRAIGLRVPGHRAILDVLRMLAGPLALSSANRSGQPEPVTAAEAIEALASKVELVLDDGPCRFGQPSSVVHVRENRYEILRVGAVPEKTLRRLSCTVMLLVCTGNTCRSPMAEVICRDMLAKRLGCSIDELEDHGVIVTSAGIAAIAGGYATPEAVKAASEIGLDLSGHETQPLSETLVRHVDLIYTMTRSHRDAIVAQWPSAADRTWMLSPGGTDICDPIGGDLQQYRCCAAQIRAELKTRVDALEL